MEDALSFSDGDSHPRLSAPTVRNVASRDPGSGVLQPREDDRLNAQAAANTMETARVRLPLRVLADTAGWTLKTWLVRKGDKVYRNQRVAVLQSPVSGAVDHALAPRSGTLSCVHVKEGTTVEFRSPPDADDAIADIEYCPHSVVFSGLCAVCGEEAVETHFAELPSGSSSRLPVAYNVSTLSVTRAEAENIASVTAKQLLLRRKLSLVLDLDHTLVHATDDPRAAAVLDHSPSGVDRASVASFVLDSRPRSNGERTTSGYAGDNRMFVKLRPHLGEFLSRCAELFELHIYTMGSRPYADQVARLIDPDKRLFSGRITSREDFEEGRCNQKSISRLFPCDDSMVLVVDDREDVWLSGTGEAYMPNLLRARPYTFWSGLHEAYNRALASGSRPADHPAKTQPGQVVDFSAPPQLLVGPNTTILVRPPTPDSDTRDKRPSVSADNEAPPPAAKEANGHAAPVAHANGSDADDDKDAAADEDETATLDTSTADEAAPSANDQASAVREGQRAPMEDFSSTLRSVVTQWWERDCSQQAGSEHLRRLATVLETCHARFFEQVPSNGSAAGTNTHAEQTVSDEKSLAHPDPIPADVKDILADMRSKLFANRVITFTGVIPLDVRPETARLWELAERHGATCTRSLVLGYTTHVVTSSEAGAMTEKAQRALSSMAVYVVDVAWLEDSTTEFQVLSELAYAVNKPTPEAWPEYQRLVEAGFAMASRARQSEAAGAPIDDARAAPNGHFVSKPPHVAGTGHDDNHDNPDGDEPPAKRPRLHEGGDGQSDAVPHRVLREDELDDVLGDALDDDDALDGYDDDADV